MDYFAANDIAAFSVVSGTPTETTNTGFFDSAYTPRGVYPNNGICQSPQFINPSTGAAVTLTNFWFHMSHFTANNGGLIELVKFFDNSNNPVARLVTTTNCTYRIDFWNGTTWITGAATFNPGGLVIDIDIHVVGGAGGTIDVYFANNKQLTIGSLTSNVANVAYFQLGGPGNYTYSQMLVSDQNTIGCKVPALTPNADSTVNTAWANDYANVVKTGFNDATMISDATLNDAESYGATDASLPTNQYIVSSVWFSIRGRLNTAAPQNIKPLMRIGTTNYNGAYNFGGLSSTTFGPSIAAFVNDPSTAAPWSGVTNLNAAEVGVITQT